MRSVAFSGKLVEAIGFMALAFMLVIMRCVADSSLSALVLHPYLQGFYALNLA
jgi:hypothetical protein